MTKDAPHKLRILHLTAGSDAGGLSRYVLDLCSEMSAQGHDLIVAGEKGEWHEMFRAAPLQWIDVPMKGNPLQLWQAVRTLRRMLAEKPVDVIHAHYRRATLVGRFLQRCHRPPLLYTLHLSHISLAGPRRWLTDFGDHVHVPSTDARTWLFDNTRYDASRVTYIPHGLHLERFPLVSETARIAARRDLKLPADATVAAYVGRLDYPKNEDWLIDLAIRLRNAAPTVHFLLAGDGPNRESLERRIRDEDLASRVHLLGQRPPLPIYHAADALLLPSIREGFSLACAEAMAAGIPVLRTRTSGTAELIVEGITGRSTEIDRDAFLTAGASFLADPASLKRMGVAAAEHIRQHFGYDQQLDQTVALYRRLAARDEQG